MRVRGLCLTKMIEILCYEILVAWKKDTIRYDSINFGPIFGRKKRMAQIPVKIQSFRTLLGPYNSNQCLISGSNFSTVYSVSFHSCWY